MLQIIKVIMPDMIPPADKTNGNIIAFQFSAIELALATTSAAHVASAKDPKRSAPIPAISPTLSPTLSPTTSSPTTTSPTLSPTTLSPTLSPTTSSPSTTTKKFSAKLSQKIAEKVLTLICVIQYIQPLNNSQIQYNEKYLANIFNTILVPPPDDVIVHLALKRRRRQLLFFKYYAEIIIKTKNKCCISLKHKIMVLLRFLKISILMH